MTTYYYCPCGGVFTWPLPQNCPRCGSPEFVTDKAWADELIQKQGRRPKASENDWKRIRETTLPGAKGPRVVKRRGKDRYGKVVK